MALDQQKLKDAILAIQNQLSQETDPIKAKEAFGELLSKAILEFVQDGEVTIDGQTGNVT